MKKLIAFIIITVTLLTTVGCSLLSGPRTTVDSLFKALETYDADAITKLVTEFPNNDDCGVTYDLFSDEVYINLYKAAYTNLSFKVASLNTENKNATMVVTVTHPDLKTAYTNATYSSMALLMSDEALYNDFMNNPDKDFSYLVPTQIRNMVQSGNVENIETTFTISLREDDDGWKIITDDELKNLISSNLYSIAANINNIQE